MLYFAHNVYIGTRIHIVLYLDVVDDVKKEILQVKKGQYTT